MRDLQIFYGNVTVATSSQIEIVAGGFTGDYYGQGFTYSATGSVVGGTLTGFSETYNGHAVVTATGLNVPATTAYQLVQSNNANQLAALALSGNDTISGAGNGDVLVGYGGNNTLVGVQTGTDYAGYSGAASAYTITADPSGFLVSRPDGGQDQLINIKGVEFSDKNVSLTGQSGVGSSSATDYLVLSPSTIGIYRFFSKIDGTHFFTVSTSEEQQLVATRPDLTFEGVGMDAVNPSNVTSDPAAVPVYRFFDSVHGTHFFTVSASEEQNLVVSRADLKLEGVGFYADQIQRSGDTAVYRFFDTGNGTHFYSSSQTETAQIGASRPDLKLEGVAFYVPTA